MPEQPPVHDTATTDPRDHADLAGLAGLAADTAADVRGFVGAVREIAAGAAPEAAMPLLLLLLSQVQVTGARLGAVTDVVPPTRFEPDVGDTTDQDALRTSLANLLHGIDDYADLVDPVTSVEIGRGAVSDDLAGIVASLEQGLAHHDAGRVLEALWWWQFGYLSEWGVRSSAALRVVQTILGHVRLDADEDVVAEAEFDALHP